MALYFTPSKTMVSHTQGHPLLHALAVSVTLNYILAFTQPALSMKDETTINVDDSLYIMQHIMH